MVLRGIGPRGDSRRPAERAKGRRKFPIEIVIPFLFGALLGSIFFGIQADAQRSQGNSPGSMNRSLVVEEIRLVDSQGKIRAKITPSPGEEGVTLALYHRDGRHATLYRLNPTGLPTMSLVPIQ